MTTIITTKADFSTYLVNGADIWSGADETKKDERIYSHSAGLRNVLFGLVATTIPAILPYSDGLFCTQPDFSVLGRTFFPPSMAAHCAKTQTPVPLTFLDAYNEMLSYRIPEDDLHETNSDQQHLVAINTAISFLALLPPEVSSPEASAAGDGTVDWYWRSGGQAATVTFYENGRIAYFALTDIGTVKDSFKFNGSIPIKLMESLLRL